VGSKTSIEWTDSTWNPIRGCTRVSEGCRNCYAESVAYRFSGAGQPFEGLAVLKNAHPSWTGKIQFVEKHLLDPLKWKAPSRIFVNSMSDLFHENVTDEMRDRIFAVMALCPQHTFQVLTKRPERMLAYLRGMNTNADAVVRAVKACHFASEALQTLPSAAQFDAIESIPRGLPNVWLGVSVENQAAADERIPLLLRTPAAVRFISAEPLLGPVDLMRLRGSVNVGGHIDLCVDALNGRYGPAWHGRNSLQPHDLTKVTGAGKLGWVICGGESGPGARPMHPDWARSLRDQCTAAGVPFFFKQWGEWLPFNQALGAQRDLRYSAHGLVYADGKMSLHKGADKPDPEFGLYTRDLDGNDGAAAVYNTGKHAAGAQLDGREWKQFPEARA
jgi:protein gp37